MSKKSSTFAPAKAQMAESVDALVSNTSRFTPVPVRPRLWVPKKQVHGTCFFLYRYSTTLFVYSFDSFVRLSIIPLYTTKRWKRYSVDRLSSILMAVTKYSFHKQSSANQLPNKVESGVKAQ